MSILRRHLAPITDAAWAAIDAEAKRVLGVKLAARKAVDVDGPHGWTHGGVNLGRLQLFKKDPMPGVCVGLRRVQPLIEIRVPFHIAMMELDSIARGAADFELDAVLQAAAKSALFEDNAILNGYKDGGIDGIVASSPHKAVTIGAADRYPAALAEAREILLQAGINGPYALLVSPDCDREISQATHAGYPVLKQIERDLEGGPMVRAEALDGALLLSIRGGDYALSLGQDLSIGYAGHDRDSVELYITESFTFRILEAKAAVPLKRTRGR
jgi:uncharacterized linocin/CFP29 family protein